MPSATSQRAVCLLITATLGLAGCQQRAQLLAGRQRAAQEWREPAPTHPPNEIAPDSKEARTYVYWNSVVNLVDSIYAISLDDSGRKPRGFFEMGTISKSAAEKINALSTVGVDEDAVKAGQQVYALLLDENDYWNTDWGAIRDYLKNNPAPVNPINNITSGIKSGLKARARVDDLNKLLAQTRALLESRYEHVTFRAPHELM